MAMENGEWIMRGLLQNSRTAAETMAATIPQRKGSQL